MNYEKDSQNQTDTKVQNQIDNHKGPLFYSAFSQFATKKTQKLVTALYMVSDCMEADEALKSKMRSLGVSLLSDIHELAQLRASDKHFTTASCVSRIDEIISFVEIAFIIGFVSEMNTNILKNEFSILRSELLKFQAKNQTNAPGNPAFASSPVTHFSINRESLAVPLPIYEEPQSLPKPFWAHDTNNVPNTNEESKGQIKDNKEHMSFTKKFEMLSFKSKMNSVSNNVPKSFTKEEKSDRKTRIVQLIKGKKEVSIKDISSSFTDCSEKTIQRELNDLVLNGQIRKSGEKRWSRYHSI